MSTEPNVTPAQELRAAASKIRDAVAKTSHTGPWVVRDWSVMTESGSIAEAHEAGDAEHIGMWHPSVASAVADWLDEVGDEMDDDHAHVIDHPKWVGLAENLRWGVHAMFYGGDKDDNGAWKTALITARAINGEVSA